MPFPSVPLRDNFTRADEGPPPSASWVTSNATGWKVVSNVGVPNSNGFCGTTWNTFFGPDCEVAIKVAQVPSPSEWSLILLCLQTPTSTPSDHYELDLFPVAGAANDTLELWKKIAGVDTQLGASFSIGAEFAVGDVIGLRRVGSTLEVFRNGVSLGTRTDSSASLSSGGYAAIRASTTAPLLNVSEFYAGTYTVSLPPALLQRTQQLFHPLLAR